jgi:pimeloyl-ACP methyl ester carboxylesterase
MNAERAVRATFGLLDLASPALAARLAQRIFFTPPRARRSPRIEAILAQARRREVDADGTRIVTWAWGAGPTVYLVHGWAGLGGQLGAFVQPLVEQGFQVVTFDGPAHGRSSGRRASIVHFARALAAVGRVFGPGRGLIAHSLGAPAAAFAMRRGFPVERAVFVAPPADPGDWSSQFARRLGVSARVMAAMRLRSERWLGVPWAEVSLTGMAAGQSAPLLVVHDQDDRDVPFRHGAAVAASGPGAQLLETTGLGHRRILRDAGVVAQAVSFIAGAPTVVADAQPPVSGLTGLASLERYLDDREARWALLAGESPAQYAMSRGA